MHRTPTPPTSTATTIAALVKRLPCHMRSPGFVVNAALSFPSLLLLVTLAWQSGGLTEGVLSAMVAAAAIATCALAPLALTADNTRQP